MYYRTNNLRKESFKWRLHEMIHARRVADTNKSQLMNILPIPEEVALTGLPPDWGRIPLYQHIPMPTMAPAGKVQFTRGTLGENILRMSKTFDLGDPYCHDLKLEYEPIHDPYLKHFLLASHVKKYIEDSGVITSQNKVKCSPKSYNAYRHYMWTVQRNGIKEQLLKKEKQHLLRKRFVDFLHVANHVKAQHLKVRSVEKGMIVRKFVRKLNVLLENMLKEQRKKESEAGTQKVVNERNDLWIIHLVKERDYPNLKALYKRRAFVATAYKGVNYVLKWRDHYLWVDEVQDLRERCRQLRDIKLDLNWDRKIAEQTSLLRRDFIIFNDYLNYSARRMRNRERWYQMDRLAMKGKFERLRYDRDYSIIKKLQKRRKYGMAADFLMDRIRHAPLAVRAWELQSKRRVYYRPKRLRLIQIPGKSFIPRTGMPVHSSGLRGRLLAGYLGKKIAHTWLIQMTKRAAFRALKVACINQLGTCMVNLKCMIGRIIHNQTFPMRTIKDLGPRYNWARKLPYKAVAENWDPKLIVRKKLILAIRRYVKHERRRLRMTEECPEWSYYDKRAAKYNSKELCIPSHWRKLKLYFPLIAEQYHKSDWKRNCKSLGKYLLYILIHNQSFTVKRRKVCSNLTQLRATICKLKNKVRIVADAIQRIIAKKIRLYYPDNIKYHLHITRGHVRSLLPKNPADGDGFCKGFLYMLGTMSLGHINFQHIIPFADKFMLYICFPKRFPLHFKAYPLDFYKRRQLRDRVYHYETSPFANLEFYQKVLKIRKLRQKHEKDLQFIMQVINPKTKKFMLLCKKMKYSKYREL
ncbi:unnamed protein product [Nezara viridula]|uniref:Uncharacterized protein n=1 Tax=Nezara viridula TaxID=85310 RepID=A0A9P0EE00_NEZVI|nr:unnamed protein product [Nezara viridula]